MLNRIYEVPAFSGIVVYGRRRVGKTSLLEEFAKDHRSLFIYSSERSFNENFSRMKDSVSTFLGKDVLDLGTFSKIMDVIAEDCLINKNLIIFDEFPYLVNDAPFVPSVMQLFIDKVRNTDTKLVLCGSSVSFLLREVRDPGRPLYQRMTHEFQVEPLSYRSCMEFHRDMSDLDAVRTYLTVGGVPLYHMRMRSRTYEASVEGAFIDQIGFLRADNLPLLTEFRPIEVYTGLVSCLAHGIVKQSKIVTATDLNSSTVSRGLKELAALGIVEPVRPMLNSPKKPVYRIKDNMVAFRFGVLDRFVNLLESRAMDEKTKYGIMKGAIDTFLGSRFELLCEEFLCSEYRILECGKWWGATDTGGTGTDGTPTFEQEDIDIVAKALDDRGRSVYIAVECKFRNRPTGEDAYHDLVRRWGSTGCKESVEHMIISTGGFTEDLTALGEDGLVTLVGLDMLLGKVPAPDLGGLRKTP